MNRQLIRFFKIVIVAISMMTVVSVTVAQTDEQVIEYRQALMHSIGGNMAAISIIIKSRLKYQDNLYDHAQQIKSASTLIKSAFEQPLFEGRTDSLPEIWANWDEFLSITKTMQDESEQLAETGAQGDLKTVIKQVKLLAKSCAKCHKKFRKPKEESYKN